VGPCRVFDKEEELAENDDDEEEEAEDAKECEAMA
jgi:hypothetical protein